MIKPLSALETEQFHATKKYILDQAKPESDAARIAYINAESIKLSKDSGVTLEEAKRVVKARANGKLTGDDILHFDDGTSVSVRDALVSPVDYDGRTLVDPCEPEIGRCKAMFFANVNTGISIVHSQLHGGVSYALIAEFQENSTAHYKWDFDEAYDLVNELGELNKTNLEIKKCTREILTSMFENNNYDRAENDDLRNLIKKKLGYNKATLDEIASDAAKNGNNKNDESLPQQSHVSSALSATMKGLWFLSAERGRWYQYNGTGLWESKESEKWEFFSKSAVEKYDEIATIGYSSSYLKGIQNLLSVDLIAEYATPPGHVIPFKNGILNSLTLELYCHAASYHFTWQLEFDYNTSAQCPIFWSWLKDRLETEQRKQLVRAVICAILQSRVDLQFFVELYGAAGAGKSVLQWLFEKLVGSANIGSTDIKSLETNRFEAAGLVDKKVIMITDSTEFAGEAAILKAITGNDLIRIEQKNIKTTGVGCRFPGIIVVASNQPIKFIDHSNAISRRRVPIHFTKPISKDEFRENIKDDLESELPGIVNWALAMPPSEMQAVIKQNKGDGRSADAREILLETNIMAMWLHDNVVYAPNERVNIGHACRSSYGSNDFSNSWLYPNYTQYLEDESKFSKPLAVNKFGSALNTLLTETLKLKKCYRLPKGPSGRQFTGIALRPSPMDRSKSPVDVAFDFLPEQPEYEQTTFF